MKSNMFKLSIATSAILAGLTCAYAQSTSAPASAPTAVKWWGKDLKGEQVNLPAKQGPSVVLFVRAEQPQSRQAVKQALPLLQGQEKVQQVLVLSGHQDQYTAQKLAQQMNWTGPVVLDPDYAICGQMGVHVWPTTVLVSSDGQQVGHLAGISNTYAKEFEAYLAFASGKIDKAKLEQTLATNRVVGDSSSQAAGRHVQVAYKLMEKGHFDQAKTELEEGIKLEPDNMAMKVTLAKVLLQLNDLKGAAPVINGLDKQAVPAWQINFLQGKLAAAKGQTDAALPLLTEALKLNPEPGETHYALGKLYEKKGDWRKAGEEYKAAYESRR